MAKINNTDETLLFVTATKYGDAICCQIGKDRKDFEKYVTLQANEAIARQLVPYRLMCCYKLNRSADLPDNLIDDPAKAKGIVTELLNNNGGITFILDLVSLPDAVYCIDRDIIPLPDEEAIHELESEYDYKKAMGNYREGFADFLKQDNNGLKVVDTDGKILFFDKTILGEISLKKYLQYQANVFFNPKNNVGSIKIYDMDKVPDYLRSIANKYDLFHNSGSMAHLNSLLNSIFLSDENLENARLLREYDMSATRENFWKFVNDDSGETLHLSPENYNILRTMVICDRGYHPNEQVNTAFLYGDGYEYDFHHKFDKMNTGLLTPKDPVQIVNLKEESKEIAAGILAYEFSNIRKSPVQEHKSKQTHETPRNRPAVNRKPNGGSTKSIKKHKL